MKLPGTNIRIRENPYGTKKRNQQNIYSERKEYTMTKFEKLLLLIVLVYAVWELAK